MYIRKKTRFKDGKSHDYWALVESYRTPKGPRQRTVAWLGELDEAGRLGIEKYTKKNTETQQDLFKTSTEPEWVEVDIKCPFGKPAQCKKSGKNSTHPIFF